MSLRRRQTQQVQLDRVQQDVDEATAPLFRAVLAGAVLTAKVALTTSFQQLGHGLGRAPQGFVVVSPDADARVWQDPTASNNIDASKFLRVRASAAVNCRLLVF